MKVLKKLFTFKELLLLELNLEVLDKVTKKVEEDEMENDEEEEEVESTQRRESRDRWWYA